MEIKAIRIDTEKAKRHKMKTTLVEFLKQIEYS